MPSPSQLSFLHYKDNSHGLGDLSSTAQESSFKELTYSTKFQNCEQEQHFQTVGC